MKLQNIILFLLFLFFTTDFLLAVPKKKSKQSTQTAKGFELVTEKEIKKWKTSRRVALIVGVNGYESLSRLTFANSDSLKMKLTLEQVGKFDEIILLNDQVGKEDTLLKPTRKNIIREFNRLTKSRPNLFLFYFSGHGFMDENGENILAPLDIVYKNKKQIKNTIKISSLVKEAKKLRQSIFFLDACREELKEGRKALEGEQFGELPEEVLNARGIGIMMGTKPGGFSYENKELGSGLFTHFLVEGISGGVQNEGPEYVTFRSLKSYVERNIKEYITKHKKEEQIPFTAGDYTGNFLIAVGRPEGKVQSQLYKYKNKNKNEILSRILYDTQKQRISQTFFTYGEGNKYIPSDLDGISKINIEQGKEKFVVQEYNLKGKEVYRYGYKYKKDVGVSISFLDNLTPKTIQYNKQKYKIAQKKDNEKNEVLYKHLRYKRKGKKLLKIEVYKDEKGIVKNNEDGIAKILYFYDK